jgi:hypothetical protein
MQQSSVVSAPPSKKYTTLIALTAIPEEDGQPFRPVNIRPAELIAYSSVGAHTRLNLTGRKTLHVRETTDQIDRLVRAASAGRSAS